MGRLGMYWTAGARDLLTSNVRLGIKKGAKRDAGEFGLSNWEAAVTIF